VIHWGWLLLAVIVGAQFGVVIMAVLAIASEADDDIERMMADDES